MSHQRDWTACKRGHVFDEVNTCITPTGDRACRTCARERMARHRERNRVPAWYETLKPVNGIIRIPLSNAEAVALIDDAGLGLIIARRNNWQLSQNGYATQMAADGGVLMHRLILDPGPGLHTDHVNRDKLDNRRANLRPATKAQNAWNTGPRVDNSSGYKGVSRTRSGRRWRATIRLDGRSKSLGVFDTAFEAALAYDCAAFEIAGEYAYLNGKAS